MKYELVYVKEYRKLIDAENNFDALAQAEKGKPANYEFQDFNKIKTVRELEDVNQKIKTQQLP